MTLDVAEFIRRFLIHVLPHGFHRIRHYGLFASAGRAENIARARELLNVPKPQSNPTDADTTDESPIPAHPCPCCGGRMIIIETFAPRLLTPLSSRAADPRHQDRHLMTTKPEFPRRKSARPSHWFSARHDHPRPNPGPGSQIQPRSSSAGVANDRRSDRLSCANPVNRRARTQPRPSRAPRQRPNHHRARAACASLPAISSLGGFRTPATSRAVRRAVRHRPASENLHTSGPTRLGSKLLTDECESVKHRGAGKLQRSLERPPQFQDKKDRSRNRQGTYKKNSDDRRVEWRKEPEAGE